MDNENFCVRRAEADDAVGIMAITREAFAHYIEMAGLDTADALNETYDDIAKDIAGKQVYVAVLGDTIIGSVRIEINGETGYLSRFGVSTEYRSLGIGRALIERIDSDMPALGVKKMYLHTASKAAPLIKLYYNCGFYIESVSTEKGYLRALLVKEYHY